MTLELAVSSVLIDSHLLMGIMELSLFIIMSEYESISECKGLLLLTFRNVKMMFDLKAV